MTTTRANLAGLSRYILRAPRWYSSLAFALVLAAITGIAAFDSSYPLGDASRGVFYIGVPTVFAALSTATVDRWVGGRLTQDQASLLALVSELVVIVVLLFAALPTLVAGVPQQFVFDGLLIALAAIFALRLFVIATVSRQSLPRAVVPASLQTVAAAVLLFVYSGTLYSLRVSGPLLETYFARPSEAPPELQQSVVPFDFVLLGVVCLIHIGAVWAFIAAIDRPWQSSLGVSVVNFVGGFIGHITTGSHELEAFFEEIGEEAMVPVTVLSFRRPGGDEKARFVLPMVHPGPMGDIGGGNLPAHIADRTEGLAFVPHATASHDFNLVTDREIGTIHEAVERAYEDIEYSTAGTASCRVREGDATLTGHRFGNDALMIASFWPEYADDIEYAVGLSAVSEAHAAGLDEVLLADAHNCNDGLAGSDTGHVVPGSERSFDLIRGARQLGERLDATEQHPLRLGTAWDETDWDVSDGIGPLGVRVAVLEAGSELTAYVLVDGNNMAPGLRERVVQSIDGVDTIEVLTTDTHVTNTVDADTRVGRQIAHEEFVGVVDSLIDRARADLEPVEAGMESELVEVTVFGNDRTETLASHANAMLPMATALATAFVFAVLSVSALIFLLASNAGL